MADTHQATVIGSGTFVRGRVTGAGDLEISGRIEGEIDCAGDVLVEQSGLVGANISARRIVVRGAVKGDLVAEESLVLEGGARVVGDLRAPRIAIAPGGLVRGHVQTGNAGASKPRSAAAASTVDRTRAASAAAAAPRTLPAATAKAAPAARKPAPPIERGAPAGNGGKAQASGAGAPGGRVGPPPPVVPALKKGTKAALHHKKRG